MRASRSQVLGGTCVVAGLVTLALGVRFQHQPSYYLYCVAYYGLTAALGPLGCYLVYKGCEGLDDELTHLIQERWHFVDYVNKQRKLGHGESEESPEQHPIKRRPVVQFEPSVEACSVNLTSSIHCSPKFDPNKIQLKKLPPQNKTIRVASAQESLDPSSLEDEPLSRPSELPLQRPHYITFPERYQPSTDELRQSSRSLSMEDSQSPAISEEDDTDSDENLSMSFSQSSVSSMPHPDRSLRRIIPGVQNSLPFVDDYDESED